MHVSSISIIGLLAEFVLIVSQLPQIYKCFKTKRAGDLSLLTIITVILGLALWIVYGVIKPDSVIVIANTASFLVFGVVLYAKLKFS